MSCFVRNTGRIFQFPKQHLISRHSANRSIESTFSCSFHILGVTIHITGNPDRTKTPS
uniref:Uncharacterized protein n=1 Tax=Heterorhabditis bacteriophora TaxID=37862 RepID=A0A1I7WED6_HETBA